MNRMVYRLLCGMVFMSAASVHAQTPKRHAAAPVVKRAQDPDVIEAGAANFAGAARFTWGDESQEVIAATGCRMTIKSVRTALSVVTVDEQTFDAGDAFGSIESRNAATAFEALIYSRSKLTPWVTRKRTVYLDGAPRGPVVEKVVFLTLAIPSDVADSQGKAMLEAFGSYRAFCEKR